MELRRYQAEAVESVYRYLRASDGNPCVVLPTGAGKSLVLAQICADAVKQWSGRVLVLAHVKELLEQSAEKIAKLCHDVPVGVYSAGLGSRQTEEPLIVAGIQSVYKRANELGRFDLVIVDEAHLLTADGDGMYRHLLDELKAINPHLCVIGLTATPFRLDSGSICGPDKILNDICFEIGVRDLILNGYLSPLISKAGKNKPNLDHLGKRLGEFIPADVDKVFNTETAVRSAVREIVDLTPDRQHVLLFAASVEYANNLRQDLERISGQEVGLILGDTASSDRERTLRRFKGELRTESLFGDMERPLKYLVNVGVLTTGFDAPNIDCVVLLRPTLSPGLYYQMVGRGFRLSPGKKDCLILDFGGNVVRHGPVDVIEPRRLALSHKTPPAKECPECGRVVHSALKICPECGFEYHFNRRGEPQMAELGHDEVVSEDKEETLGVLSVFYTPHIKKDAPENAPQTLKAAYEIGLGQYRYEWVCPEHDGWARKKFERWWRERSKYPFPETAEEAARIGNAGGIARPSSITLRRKAGERYFSIVGAEIDSQNIPEMQNELPEHLCEGCYHCIQSCWLDPEHPVEIDKKQQACDKYVVTSDIPF